MNGELLSENAKQKIYEQIHSKMLSQVAQGIERFPKLKEAEVVVSSQSISQCTACPLSETRKRVVVEKSLEHKKFFILSDFPDKEDEDSNEIYSINSNSSSLILKLLEKLGIASDSYYSFALKCYTIKQIPETSFATCVQKNLFAELNSTSPDVILCFGHRALGALTFLQPSLAQSYYVENSELQSFCIKNKLVRLFFVSSARDLRDFPHWRMQVWQKLSSALN